VTIIEPQLAIFRLGIGVTQVYLAVPDRLDLRTPEHNACLKGFLDMIVVVGFAIDSYHAGTLRHIEILAPGRRAGNLKHASLETHRRSLFILLPQTIERVHPKSSGYCYSCGQPPQAAAVL